MATHKNRWTLDTCQCIVEFSWDDEVPEDSRVHTVSEVVQTCARHQGNPFVTGQVLEHANHRAKAENKRKNDVWSEALTRLTGNSTYTGTDPESGTVVWKGDKVFQWSFTEAGVLEILITPALTSSQRNQLQNACNQRFGTGTVVIL